MCGTCLVKERWVLIPENIGSAEASVPSTGVPLWDSGAEVSKRKGLVDRKTWAIGAKKIPLLRRPGQKREAIVLGDTSNQGRFLRPAS